MAKIELIDVSKRLQSGGSGGGWLERLFNPPRETRTFAIEHVDLHIPDGRTLVVLGPSGCGKSTLLKLIAGLIVPDAGRVRYNGVDMADVPVGERRIGMVFQDYALYPHLTARENVLSYFLFRDRTPELDREAREKFQRTSELLGVELAQLLDRRPTRLSGGERQRVAIGRCITRDPALFLLDEPFSNLDHNLREKYRSNLKKLLDRFGITTVYVTHDQQEALLFGDYVAVMNAGRIEQVGTPEDIYHAPQSLFVAEFLNPGTGTAPINLIEGRLLSEEFRDGIVGVRPEDIELRQGEGHVRGTVTEVRHIPISHVTLVRIEVERHPIHVQTRLLKSAPAEAAVWLHFKRYHVFDRVSGRKLGSHPPPGG